MLIAMNALTAIGLFVQVLGGLVAFWGLVKTHDAYAERSVEAIARARVGRVRDLLASALRRMFRRPIRRTVEGTAALSGGGAFTAQGVIAYGPLPDDMPVREAISILDHRLRQTSDRLTRAEGEVTQLGNETRNELTHIREQVPQDAATFRELVRNAAIEGLMTEAVGLVMVTVGAVLQGFGSVGSS